MSSVAELLPSVVLAERTVPSLARAQERLASAQGTLSELASCIQQVANAAAAAQQQAVALSRIRALGYPTRPLAPQHASVFHLASAEVSVLTKQGALRAVFHLAVIAYRRLVDSVRGVVDFHGVTNFQVASEASRLFPMVNVRGVQCRCRDRELTSFLRRTASSPSRIISSV